MNFRKQTIKQTITQTVKRIASAHRKFLEVLHKLDKEMETLKKGLDEQGNSLRQMFKDDEVSCATGSSNMSGEDWMKKVASDTIQLQ